MVDRDERGRVKKGSVLNPMGRIPRAVEDNVTALLDSGVDGDDWIEIVDKLKKMAKSGNLAAIIALFDRRYGKPTEKHEVTGKDGEAQKVLIEYVNSPYPIAGVSSGSSGNPPKPE